MATLVERGSGRASKKLSGKEGGTSSPHQSKAGAGKEASSAGSNSPLQKLKFCMYHLQGVCKYSGNSCPFAHSIEEIHQARGRKRPVRRSACAGTGLSRNDFQMHEDQLKANMSEQHSPSGSQSGSSSGTPPREGRTSGPVLREPMFVKPFRPPSVVTDSPNGVKKEAGAAPGIGQDYASLQAQVLSLLEGMENGQGGTVDNQTVPVGAVAGPMAGITSKDRCAGFGGGGAISPTDFQVLSQSIGSLASILSNLHYSADQIMASNACNQGHLPFPLGGLPPAYTAPPYPQLPVLTPDLPAFAAAALGACDLPLGGSTQVDSTLSYRHPEVPVSAGIAAGLQIPPANVVDEGLFSIRPPPGL